MARAGIRDRWRELNAARPGPGPLAVWALALGLGAGLGLITGVGNGALIRADAPARSDVAASAAAVAWAERTFPTFEPVTVHGRGDADVELPAHAGIISATYRGDDDFNVVVVDRFDRMTDVDYAVSTVGAYRGHTAFGYDSSDAVALRVTADDGASWNLTISPIASAPGFTSAGTGDAVLLHEGEPATMTAMHGGERPILITELTGDADATSTSLLFNESAVSGEPARLGAGPSLVVVEAVGDWSLTID